MGPCRQITPSQNPTLILANSTPSVPSGFAGHPSHPNATLATQMSNLPPQHRPLLCPGFRPHRGSVAARASEAPHSPCSLHTLEPTSRHRRASKSISNSQCSRAGMNQTMGCCPAVSETHQWSGGRCSIRSTNSKPPPPPPPPPPSASQYPHFPSVFLPGPNCTLCAAHKYERQFGMHHAGERRLQVL